jgi:hypothetical protein
LKEDAMSTDVRTHAGQAPSAAGDEAPAAAGTRETPQTIVQESIKYRRRAQEAERRAEALKTEIQTLREGQDGRAAALESELSQARAEAETLRSQFAAAQRDRQLERELARAGCADPETALALARERLAGGADPEDPAAFVRGLLEEKPHLRGTAPSLPPRTAAAKPSGPPARTADRLAERARSTGSTGDLMAYLRAKRTGA